MELPVAPQTEMNLNVPSSCPSLVETACLCDRNPKILLGLGSKEALLLPLCYHAIKSHGLNEICDQT